MKRRYLKKGEIRYDIGGDKIFIVHETTRDKIKLQFSNHNFKLWGNDCIHTVDFGRKHNEKWLLGTTKKLGVL